MRNNTTENSLGVLLSSIDPGDQPACTSNQQQIIGKKKDKSNRGRKKEQEKAIKQERRWEEGRKRKEKGRKEGRKKNLLSLDKGPGKENHSRASIRRYIFNGSSRPNPLIAISRSRS